MQRLHPGGAAETEGSFPETDLASGPSHAGLARAYGGDGLVVRSAGDGPVVRSAGDLPEAVEHCLGLQADGRCGVIDIQLPGC